MASRSIREHFNRIAARGGRVLIALACLGTSLAQADTVTINVKPADGTTFGGGFRYTIQEDPTYDVVPDVTGLTGNADTDPTLATAFHRSYAKIVKVGHVSTGDTVDFAQADPSKRYFVTVMPDNASFGDATPTGYTMNGAGFKGSVPSVNVPVNKLPFKTAQVSVLVFEDNFPVNGSPDAPGEQEQPLCGWEVQLFEAGGTYGASGGRVGTDTFGNWLGTEYAFEADGVTPRYNGDGSLMIAKPGTNLFYTDRNGVVRIKNLSPAKYTIYSIPPADMPSASRCNFGDDAKTPIWVRTENDRTRPDQMVWDTGFELKPTVSDPSKWHQTTTIEGTWGVDAWVKSGEPTFFKEFGPPGHHVWHGFIRRFKDTAALNGNASVTGKVVSTHMSRPPGIRFYSGKPMEACWVAINELTTGTGAGRTLYANACDPRSGHEGEFTIGGLRAGARYQLSIWDDPLDNVIANYEFSVPATGGTVALNDVPVFSWFSNLQGKVFYDKNATGFLYDGTTEKPGIPNSILNIRFRDGSIYQSVVTDDEGKYEFPEFFPFFNWMVAETDFTRFKATGATVIADNGGAVVNPPSATPNLWPSNTLTPQAQPENGNKPYRIFGFENPDGTGAASPSSANLLQGIQGFLGQTNVIHWGKKDYDVKDPYDHGGITGIVHYAGTRAEFDPKYATAENNEPGVPSVEIRLYKLDNNNKVINPADPTGARIEPKDANASHAVQVVVSDNWDKMQPQDCVDPLPYADRTGLSFATKPGHSRCYDGMRIWNQVRDGAFDGGWAFVDHCPSGVVINSARDEHGNLVVGDDNSIDVGCVGGGAPEALPPGRYMTEAVAPYGYEHQKEEDKNVDFGDLLSPGTLANPVDCIGSRSEAVTYDDMGNPVQVLTDTVPEELVLFPGVQIPDRFRFNRPYCNKKLVVVAPGMNPFSDFHVFATAAPAGHIVGMILDDLANEFDPYAPSFGEKYAPPFMPISIRDYAGNEINRVYSDRYGTYNALVPSTFAYNVPLPSGVAPNMVNVCLNSPTMKDPATGKTVVDPHYNPQYTQYCYTFQYLPGKTTYLDTPVLPIAAFAGPSQYALDTEQPDGTPAIKMVTTNNNADGPRVPTGGGAIKIVAMGDALVSNPKYEQTNLGGPNTSTGNGGPAEPKNIVRHYGFGATRGTGQVFIGGTNVTANVSSWSDLEINVNVPAGVSGTVEVVAGNGRRTVRGVTLHAEDASPIVVGESRPIKSIQAAIDSAADGALILVDPGVYEEAPIVWKRVRVQGWGAPATIVNSAMGAEYNKQAAWRAKACDLVLNQGMSAALITGQTVPADLNACLTGDTVDNAPLIFAEEEGSGFFVLQKPVGNPALASLTKLQIDGFTITGADTGGGLVVNGNAAQMQISNNRITGNQGLFNGGIRIGHADLTNGDLPVDANNVLVNIHHNEILKNGNTAGDTAGGGGGISIYTGAKGYRVANNYIAGNFSTGDGGGMAHYGNSGTYAAAGAGLVTQDNRSGNNYASVIIDNQFRFNQSFSQAKSVQGGGLVIMGAIDPVAANGLSLGTGNVTVANNTFQGNLAGAGDGGGIALVGVNGSADVTSNVRNNWNRVDILNNVIVNNGAGMTGGGISLQDSVNVNIVNNTVSMNDSYATANRAFTNSPTAANNCAQGTGPAGCSRIAASALQLGAGIVEYGHSTGLLQLMLTSNVGLTSKATYFSDASIINNVVEGNRRFSWSINYAVDQTQTSCGYDANGAANPCFGLSAMASQTASGNDVAVVAAVGPLLAINRTPTTSYSTFTALNLNDGTALGALNRAGDITTPGTDFSSFYYLGSNGSLKQLVYALEQSVVKGAPVGETAGTGTFTSPSTAAAFDEGGNFIDVRFGPLTRGSVVSGNWIDFGTYSPSGSATANALSSFGGGLNTVPSTVSNLLAKDRNGVTRASGNFIRGALVQ